MRKWTFLIACGVVLGGAACRDVVTGVIGPWVELVVNPTQFTVGGRSQVTAFVRRSNGTISTARRDVPRLSSTNVAVATVDAASSVITGVAPGTAEIVAEWRGRRSTVQVIVVDRRD